MLTLDNRCRGSPADAVPVVGGQLDAAVRWRGGRTRAAFAGTPINLKFYLTGAELYSFWFTS